MTVAIDIPQWIAKRVLHVDDDGVILPTGEIVDVEPEGDEPSGAES